MSTISSKAELALIVRETADKSDGKQTAEQLNASITPEIQGRIAREEDVTVEEILRCFRRTTQ